MRLHKLLATLTATIVTAAPALAQQIPTDGVCENCDAVGNLPGPGMLSLVVVGIVAAIGLARRRS